LPYEAQDVLTIHLQEPVGSVFNSPSAHRIVPSIQLAQKALKLKAGSVVVFPAEALARLLQLPSQTVANEELEIHARLQESVVKPERRAVRLIGVAPAPSGSIPTALTRTLCISSASARTASPSGVSTFGGS
jgi:hypothetical protein